MLSESWREEHSKYIKSAQWKKKRIQALDHHGKACACCGSNNQVEVHHISYLNCPGNEKMTDLIPLCKSHHQLVHKYIAELREKYKYMATYSWLKASKEAIKAVLSTRSKKYVPKSKRKKAKCERKQKPPKKKTKKLTRNQRKILRRKEQLKRKAELKALNHSNKPFLSKKSLEKLESLPDFITYLKQ